jgi:hypothetical protein
VYRFAYERPGYYQPTLTVTDDANQTQTVAAAAKATPIRPAQAARSGGAMGWTWLLAMLGVGIARRRRGC